MRNHYVPEFLLRGWSESTPDGRVEVFRFDLDRLRSDRHARRYTGFENDLYALTEPEVAGMEKHAVEKYFLRRVDNEAALVHTKLVEHGLKDLTLAERSAWVRFLVSLPVRQPNIVLELRREAADHLRNRLRSNPEEFEALSGDEIVPTPEEWTERQFPGLIENFGMSFFHELVDNPDVGNRILRTKWWLWDFSGTGRELVLADVPLILTTGIDDPNLIIALPITFDKAFMTTRSEQAATALRSHDARSLAERINQSSVMQARVRVYARNRNPLRFIQNRLHRRSSINV